MFLSDIKIQPSSLSLRTKLPYLAHKSVTDVFLLFSEKKRQNNLFIPISLVKRSRGQWFLHFYKEWMKLLTKFLSVYCLRLVSIPALQNFFKVVNHSENAAPNFESKSRLKQFIIIVHNFFIVPHQEKENKSCID